MKSKKKDDGKETNERGGRQSRVPFRLDLLPAEAMLRLGQVLKRGSAYGKNNWRLIPAQDHINHALTHILAHQLLVDQRKHKSELAELLEVFELEEDEDHLGHALCRLAFAMEADADD